MRSTRPKLNRKRSPEPLRARRPEELFLRNGSELTNSQFDDATYAYNYDNIGKAADGCKAVGRVPAGIFSRK